MRSASWLVALVLAACSSPAPAAWRPDPHDLPDGGSRVVAADLPCDVAEVLSTRCVPCHADPAVGASESFTSYEALTAPSLLDPDRSVVEVAVELMQSDTDPMPPEPAAPGTETEIAVFQGWIDAGLPTGDCPVEDPYDTPVHCSTDSFWRGGNRESPNMRPGGECIDCHTRMREGPIFSIAGTVYETAHEPDDCNGTPASLADTIVEITDATGVVRQLAVNSVGNFGTINRVELPYTARVLYQGRVRAMVTPQESGDCNTCHTEAGTEGAPGRVMLP